MKKFGQIIFNIFMTIITIIVIWGAGSSIMDSVFKYGIILTILSLIVGIPIFMGVIVLSKIVDKKFKR
jgi:hypothetical protein